MTFDVGTGQNMRTFHVHKKCFCEASPLFSGGLTSPGFPEAQTGHVTLPEDDPIAFGIVVYFIYKAEVTVPVSTKDRILAYVPAEKVSEGNCKIL